MILPRDAIWYQTITDEARNALKRTPEELRASVQAHYTAITDITRKHKPTDKDAVEYALQVIEHAMHAANYSDALIQKVPDEPTIYEEITSVLFTIQYKEILNASQQASALSVPKLNRKEKPTGAIAPTKFHRQGKKKR